MIMRSILSSFTCRMSSYRIIVNVVVIVHIVQ
jgi:hypothetical protein